MLTISTEQYDKLGDAYFKNYKLSLIPYVQEHFPIHANYLNDDGIYAVIEQSCVAAEKYGFESKRDICLYINLCIMLGTCFDTDPQLPHLAKILAAEYPLALDERMDLLWDEAIIKIEETLGPDEVFPIQECTLALGSNYETLCSNHDTVIAAVTKHFHEVWPQKAALICDDLRLELTDFCCSTAAQYGIVHQQGQIEYTTMAFLLGHQFDKDPLFPWISKILQDDAYPDGVERMTTLISETKKEFKEILANVTAN